MAASSIAMLGSERRNTLQHHFPCFWKNRARFAVSQTEISNAHLMQWQQFVLSKNYPSPVFFLSFFFFSYAREKIHILLKDQSVPFPLRAGVSQG